MIGLINPHTERNAARRSFHSNPIPRGFRKRMLFFILLLHKLVSSHCSFHSKLIQRDLQNDSYFFLVNARISQFINGINGNKSENFNNDSIYGADSTIYVGFWI